MGAAAAAVAIRVDAVTRCEVLIIIPLDELNLCGANWFREFVVAEATFRYRREAELKFVADRRIK